MKKKSLILMLCFCLLPAGCGRQDARAMQQKTERESNGETQSEKEHKEERQEREASVSGSPSGKEVVMVYMVGSDLESEGGMATADIEEMQYSGFDEDEMTVLICTGGTSHWWTEEIPNDSCTVFEVKQDGLKEVYSLGEEDMAEPSTLSDFVNFAYQSYPAEDYGLVL